MRKIMDKTQMEQWLKEFYPNENLDKLFTKIPDNSSDVWTFVNVQGTFIGKIIIREYDVFGSTTQYVDIERYIILPQVSMYF